MNLDQQPISSRRDRRLGHWRNFVPAPRRMARIRYNRQMGQFLDNRDGGYIQSVSKICFKGPDPALANNDLVITARHYVFGSKQRLLDRRCGPALQQDWLVDPPQLAQQVEVLHISSADLQDIDIPDEEWNLGGLHDFGYDEHVKTVRRLPQVLESLFAQTLKGIGRGAGLEGSAA